MMIFEDFTSDSEVNESKLILASLCLVCSLFRAVCQPQIFQHLTFDGEVKHMKFTDNRENWRISLAAGDSRCAALSSYIKSCKYQLWCFDDCPSVLAVCADYASLLHKNIVSSSSLRLLKTICLYGCPLDASILLALADLRTVTAVDIYECRATNQITPDELANVSKGGWTSLRVIGVDFLEWLAPAFGKLVDQRNLQSLVTDETAVDLVHDLFAREEATYDHLTTLDIAGPKLSSSFLGHLARARGLRCVFVKEPFVFFGDFVLPLVCRLELSSPFDGILLVCTVKIWEAVGDAVDGFNMLDFQNLLGAWNPSPCLQHISFDMVINFQTPDNTGRMLTTKQTDIPMDMLRLVFEFLGRLKVGSHLSKFLHITNTGTSEQKQCL